MSRAAQSFIAVLVFALLALVLGAAFVRTSDTAVLGVGLIGLSLVMGGLGVARLRSSQR